MNLITIVIYILDFQGYYLVRLILLRQIMKYTLILILFFSVYLFPSVYGKLEGYVYDKNKEPVIGATVIVWGSMSVVQTDINGYYYILGIRSGKYEVTCQNMGYSQVSYNIRVKSEYTTMQNFMIFPMTFNPPTEEEIREYSRFGKKHRIQKDKTSSRNTRTSDDLER